MERSMNGVCATTDDSFAAECTRQDKSASRFSVLVHAREDAVMPNTCGHNDIYQNAMRMHVNMDAENHHAECTPSHMDMDVIDHHVDCSLPPPFDSSDTSATSPRSSLDPHQYPLEFLPFLQGSDPVKEELDRLQNEVREKNRELVGVRTEIKALKIAERSREKALEELADELGRVDERLERAELLLENKNLELKRTSEEKKAAQAAQHAAEAIVRRVQAAHMRDEELPPIEAILAPLDAELKLTRQEVARLHEDNRALDRLTKSKEAALLEAERTVEIATAKVSMVEDLQNKNQELVKHIEFLQEENKVLDKLHRQKITEVEKLSLRVAELEEVLLSCGLNEANAARDYQRQLQELQEEKKALERELARAKIVANRVSTVIANGWKGSNDKVMPVKHWLEERRLLQSEMEQLRQKLASMERTAKAEAILKEKVQIRLKVLEESMMLSAPLRNALQARSPTHAFGGAASALIRHATPIMEPQIASKSVNLSRSSKTHTTATAGTRKSAVSRRVLKVDELEGSRKLVARCNTVHEILLQSNVRSTCQSFNVRSTCQSFNLPSVADFDVDKNLVKQDVSYSDSTNVMHSTLASCPNGLKDAMVASEQTDFVSGQLYDLLQKEVILLRKTCQQKDRDLSEKENTIEMLEKKVNSLNRSIEIESKKVRREVAALEKEVVALRSSVAVTSPRLPLKHKKNNPSPHLIS